MRSMSPPRRTGGDRWKTPWTMIAIATTLAALSIVFVAGAQATDAPWKVTQIGDRASAAIAVNDAGFVAETVGTSPSRAAIWKDGVTTLLPLPDSAVGSNAVGINAHGDVVGAVQLQYEDGPTQTEAALWPAAGGVTLLGFLPGGGFSGATDINDSGVVVGAASSSGGYRGFVWSGNGPMEALATPPGTTEAFAQAINNKGQIVGGADAGYVPAPPPPPVAVLWDQGVPITLPPLAEGAVAYATDINDFGQIVGNSAPTGIPWLVRDAVLWQEGQVTDLGSLGGYFAIASAINNDGVAVGTMTDTSGLTHAVLWKNLVRTTLDPLTGDSASYANDVNGRGDVVGFSGSYPSSAAVIWKQPSLVDQVADLIALVDSYQLKALGTSLHDKLVAVQDLLKANKPKEASGKLTAFMNQVKAQTGKGLTPAQAAELTSRAQDIKAVLGG